MALRSRGFAVNVTLQSSGFCRLEVRSESDETLVDLGFDPAARPAVERSVGKVRDLRDLAGDKLGALFSRAALGTLWTCMGY